MLFLAIWIFTTNSMRKQKEEITFLNEINQIQNDVNFQRFEHMYPNV